MSNSESAGQLQAKICTCGRYFDEEGLRASWVGKPFPKGSTHHFDTLPCHDGDCDETSCPDYGVVSWAKKMRDRTTG